VGSDGKEINEGASRHQQPLFIAADHPVFAGHFPDAPVVPGVLLLSRVLDAAAAWLGAEVNPIGLRQAKFPAPWLPGMQVLASLEHDGRQLRFEVTADDQTLARGVFELPPAGDAPKQEVE
jgi:3-hydroxymyristoyl/3-hydroxydecanoyl-(acyl carrier protein) dehydratase